MRIAFFTDSYKPQVNGVVKSIEVFRRELEKKGHKVTVFAPEDPDYQEKEKFVYRFKSIPFISYRGYRIGVPYQVLTDSRFKKIDFDIIHVQSPFSIGALGLGVGKHFHIPVVGTFHTMFPEYIHYFIKNKKLQSIKELNFLFEKFSWKCLSWFYNQCENVIVPTEATKHILLKNGFEKEVKIIPTGIYSGNKKNNKNSEKAVKKIIKKKSKDKIVLHVGRVTEEKNIKFIVDSLKPALKDGVKLVISSDGPYREELEKYVSGNNNKIENVIFTGYLSEDELTGLYRLSDLLVVASKTETQSIVILEAISNNLPVLVVDAPVTGDIVKKYGIGIASREEDFLKNAEIMLHDKKAADKFRKNFKRMIEDFDIKTCTQKLVEIYENTIKNYDQ